MNALSGKPLPFARAFDDMQETVNWRFLLPYWQLWRWCGVAHERRSRQAAKVIDEFAYRVIETRRQEAAAGGGVGGGGGDAAMADAQGRADLLSRFVALKDDDGWVAAGARVCARARGCVCADGGVQRAGHQVVGVLALPAQQPVVLDALDGLAEELGGHGCSPSDPSRTISAARHTAETMFW